MSGAILDNEMIKSSQTPSVYVFCHIYLLSVFLNRRAGDDCVPFLEAALGGARDYAESCRQLSRLEV